MFMIMYKAVLIVEMEPDGKEILSFINKIKCICANKNLICNMY